MRNDFENCRFRDIEHIRSLPFDRKHATGHPTFWPVQESDLRRIVREISHIVLFILTLKLKEFLSNKRYSVPHFALAQKNYQFGFRIFSESSLRSDFSMTLSLMRIQIIGLS
jgi:hypothetical protein